MPSPSATPTPITPPRVPLIDARTGLIDRAWYMFFLSLFKAADSVDPNVAPDASALLASYDAALRNLEDQVGTQTEAQVSEIKAQVAELQKQIIGLMLQVRPELGTLSTVNIDWVPYLGFDTAPPWIGTTAGEFWYDSATGSFNAKMGGNNITQQIGEELFRYGKASAAITDSPLQIVYKTGVVGASGVITFAPAIAGITDSDQILGCATEPIPLNGFGRITTYGVIHGINTTGAAVGEVWVDNDDIWYNPATGNPTKVKPSAPGLKLLVGTVINAGGGGSGSFIVKLGASSTLGGTDSNVQFSGLANKDLIQYDSALQYWKNVAPSAIAIGTATNLAGGAAGSVPYQTAASTTSFLPIGTAAQVLKVNAGATAPEWVSGAALTKVDDTNVTLTFGGSPTSALLAATSITVGWSGSLAVGRGGTGQTTYTDGQLLIGNSVGNTLTKATLTAGSGITITNGAGSITIASAGGGGTVTSVGASFTGGLVSIAGSPITTAGTLAFTVAGTSGGIPYFSSATTWASSAALALNALMVGGGAGGAPATITTGTGVVTALGVNTGTAGSFVVNGGALGTPSSGTVTNLTGTASININGTVGATTPTTGAFTTVTTSGNIGAGTPSPTYRVTTLDSTALATAAVAVAMGTNAGGSSGTHAALGFYAESTGYGSLLFYTKRGGSLFEVARFDSAGRLLINATSFQSGAEYFELVNNSAGIYNFANNALGVYTNYYKSRSTTVGGNTLVVNNDILGAQAYYGNDGSTFVEGARIIGFVDGTPTLAGGDMPARLSFYTRQIGDLNPVERWRMDANGNLNGVNTVYLGSVIASSAYASVGFVNTGDLVLSADPNSLAAGSKLVHKVDNVERVRTDSSGFTQFSSNAVMPYQGAPTSKAAAATLTGAELITGILNTTGTTYTITLPTGTTIEGALTWAGNNVCLDWWVINTALGTITIAANGNTTLGSLTIATGVSAHFRIRRTAANTFTVYRLS